MDWRLRDLLWRIRPTQQSAPPDSEVEPDGGVTTKLYTCSDCERTCISEGMDSCSECGARVTQVPSEAGPRLRFPGQVTRHVPRSDRTTRDGD